MPVTHAKNPGSFDPGFLNFRRRPPDQAATGAARAASIFSLRTFSLNGLMM